MLWSCRKLVFICKQKINLISHAIPEILQRYVKLFWVPWVFLLTHTQKMIVSIYRILWYLSTCHKYTSSFNSILRYCILNNPVIWLANSILADNSRLRNYYIWDWSWNINDNISFHFRLFPRKINNKTFQNMQKVMSYCYKKYQTDGWIDRQRWFYRTLRMPRVGLLK